MLAHLHVNVLPHTARRRRAIKHFCCKSAYIKLNPFLNKCGLQDAERPTRIRYGTFYCHDVGHLSLSRQTAALHSAGEELKTMRAQRDRKSIGVSLSNRTLLAEDRPYAGIDVPAYFLQRHQPRRT